MLISAGRSSNPLGTLLLTAGVSGLGMALTFVLPEPARRSLEDMPFATPAVALSCCA